MSELNDWLHEELNSRAWSYSELARRAGISQASVSNVLKSKQTPGLEFCKGMAVALDTPLDRVLRMAGHLPPLLPAVEQEREAVRLFRALSEQMRAAALSILSTLQGASGGSQGSDRPAASDPHTLSEHLAQDLARELEHMPPEDQQKVFDLMKRLRGEGRGAGEAEGVPLASDP
jgi:transcriptional regulator with XRE-family HTH domain